MTQPDRLPSRLDRAPWRPIHSTILLALGIGWALDSFEVQIIGSVLGPLAKDFGLLDASGSIRASAVSTIWIVWFAGLMVGATTFGWLADRYGRKRLFVATLVMYAAATVLSAFAPTFAVFLLFRFVTALGVGGEYSAVTTAVAEFMPLRRRGATTATTMNFWSIGGIVSGLVGLVFLNGFVSKQVALAGGSISAWRLCLLAGAAAALYALYARRAIPESPRWLASQGRLLEADAIVTRISGISDAGSDDLVAPPARSLGGQIGELWAGYRGRLVYGATLEFAGSAAYYGLFTFIAAYVLVKGQVEVSAGAVPLFYLVGNVGALVGGLTIAVAIDRIGRGNTVLLSYGTATVSVLLLTLAAVAKSPALTLAAFTLCVFSATCSWISAYTTFAELFPTELRATGVGLCVACGRLGGMVGVVGLSYVTNGLGLVPAFVLLAVFFGIGAVAAAVWRGRGVEAMGLTLEQVSPRIPVAA